MPAFAFATLVTSDAYAQGAQVVAAALRELHPTPPTPPEVEFETVCIVTPETVDVSTIRALRKAFDVVIGVEVIDERQTEGLALLGRPDLHLVLTKLHVFRLTQYSKVIFLDADVLPVRPLSHLFTLPYEFSAVPDVGWPDIFNSGMMVLTPGEDKFQEVRQLAKTRGSWDGGDQGVLNEWRGDDWHRLSFTYNTTPTAAYTYAPAYERFGSKISVIHFIGSNKPWKSAAWRPPFARSSSAPEPSSQPTPQPSTSTPQAHTAYISEPGFIPYSLSNPTPTPLPAPPAPAPTNQQSYAYESLVDRWYDVYDRHVRTEPVLQPVYEPQRYESAWSAPLEAPAHSYDLEELKKLALEGSGQAQSAPGEGQYVSLPLDGRIDLMRPPPSPPPPAQESATGHSHDYGRPHETWEHHSPPEGDRTPTATYPVPLAAPVPHHAHQAHTEHHHEEPYRPPSPPLVNWNPAIEPPPTTFVHNPTQQQIGEYYTNVWDLPQSYQESHHPSHDQHHQGQQEAQQYWQQEYRPEQPVHGDDRGRAYDRARDEHQHQHREQYQHQQQHHYHHPPPHFQGAQHEPHAHQRVPSPKPREFFHVHSPPAIPASVAHEYAQVTHHAPNLSKVQSVFPWENASRPTPGRVWPTGDGPPPRRSVTAPAEVDVSSQDSQGSPQTHPMLSFQEASPPGQYGEYQQNPPLSSQQLQTQGDISPARPDGRTRYAPGERRPGSLVYANAWDTVPSIQTYVSRLVKPTSRSRSSTLEAQGRADGRGSPSTRRDSVSGPVNEEDADDGDDEEDTDEETGHDTPQASRGLRGTESPAGGRSSGSSRSGRSRRESSATGRYSPTTQGPGLAGGVVVPSGRVYRSQGVQTTPKSRRSIGVQVSVSSQVEPTHVHRSSPLAAGGSVLPRSTPPQHSQSAVSPMSPLSLRTDLGKQGRSFGSAAPFALPATSSPPVVSEEIEQFGTPGQSMLDSPIHLATQYTPPSMTALRKSSDPAPPSPLSPAATSSTLASPSLLRPRPRQRSTSNATDPTVRNSWMSTSSSGTIVEPVANVSSPEGIITQPRATRRWDPARGVEVFKRDSQEVLARFLRMGQWGTDGSEGSSEQPPT